MTQPKELAVWPPFAVWPRFALVRLSFLAGWTAVDVVVGRRKKEEKKVSCMRKWNGYWLKS